MNWNQYGKRNLSLLGLLLLVLFNWGCSKGDEQVKDKQALLEQKREELRLLKQEIATLEAELNPEKQQDESTLVRTLLVEKQTFKHYVELQGSVQSDDLITVSTETGGRLIDLKVREGQYVRKGQLLARFDLSELEKQLAELEVSLDLAREVYERQKRLWEQEIGSEIQYLQAKNKFDRLEKTKEALETRLAKAQIYAPLSGQIEKLMVKPGEVAAPGMPVLQLLNTRKVKVVAEVPENYLSIVKRGVKVEIEFPVLGLKRMARIDAVGQLINPSNRTFEAEAWLDNPDALLKPNLLGVIRLNDKTLKNVIVVPAELVQNEVGGKEFVFVLDKDEKGFLVRKTYVKTGLRQSGKVEIQEGLQAGQELIAEGAYKLVDGQRVRLK